MPTYGRQALGVTGNLLEVSADGSPDWKPGGITLLWSTVDAAATETTLGDGTIVPSGARAIPYGTVLCAITTSGATQGKYGPYSAAASDGRQTLTRGSAYILNTTVLEFSPSLVAPAASDHPAVIEGGLLWRARLRIGASGQPAVADFETAFPRVRYAQ